MKRTLLSMFILCCGNSFGGVIMLEYASPAPNSFNSPSFAAWGANAIYALENNLSSVGDPLTSPDAYYQVTQATDSSNIVSHTPSVILSWLGQADPGTVFGAAFANETGNRLQFGLVALGTDGTKISVSELSWNMHSSDPDNGFQYSGSFAGSTYNQYRVGLIFNGSDPPTVITSGPADQLVDELVYVGIGNAVQPDDSCTGTDQQKLDCAKAFYDSFSPFILTTDYTLTDNSGVIGTSSASVSFVTPEPSPRLLLLSGCFAGVLFRRRLSQAA